jgi:hypothetical protein
MNENSHDTHCPSCGDKGKSIDTQTVKTLLALSLRLLQADAYRFCSTPTCPLVYFSGDGTEQYRESDLRERVYQKHLHDADVFVCYCFRHSLGALQSDPATVDADSIVADIKSGIQAGQCACEIRNPQGSCCLGNVVTIARRDQTSRSTTAGPATR